MVDYSETIDGETTHELIDSLIRTYLQVPTQTIAAPWVLSAFVDNAGIMAFTMTMTSLSRPRHTTIPRR